MVEVRIHINGVAHLTVTVGAQRVGVALILPGTEIVSFLFVRVNSRILGMGAVVAGGTMDAAGVIMPVAIQIITTGGPDTKGAICLRRGKVYMTGKAIRLLQPGSARFYPGKSCRYPWFKMLHQPGCPGFPGIFFGQKQGQGVVFQGTVAVGAVKAGLVMDTTEKTSGSLWIAWVAESTGLCAPAIQEIGVETVHGS